MSCIAAARLVGRRDRIPWRMRRCDQPDPSVPREMAQPREMIMAFSWDRGSERANERGEERDAQSMVIKIAPTHKKSEIPDLGAVASFSQRIQRNRPAPLQFCGSWAVRSVSNS